MPQKNLHYLECYFCPLFIVICIQLLFLFLLKMCTKEDRGTTGILKTHLTSDPLITCRLQLSSLQHYTAECFLGNAKNVELS